MSINRKTDALIVVDIQNDFCPGGALGVKDGDKIIPAVNDLIPKFDHIIITRDWHPQNHVSFSENPQFVDKSWPAHCVAETDGAQFHPDLNVPDKALIISKGTDPEREAYSSFQATDLAMKLQIRGIKKVYICGLATDYCVKNTALDALGNDFEAVVLEDLIRGVDIPQGTVQEAITEMRSAGVKFLKSEQI